VVSCTNTQAGLDCSVGQQLVFQSGGRNFQVAAAVRIPPDTKKPNLLLQVPLGVSLPKGITIQFGGGDAKALAFQSCSQNGCWAEYSITEPEIASLSKGSDLKLSVRTADNAPVQFNVPAVGFAGAYAKIRGQ
jgi:invasion protein IalB